VTGTTGGPGPDTRPRTAAGLTTEQVARRLAEHGPNVLPAERRPSVLRSLARQLVHLFALLLWGAAALAVLAGMPQLGIAIVVVIVVNGGFAFVQEYRADRAVDRLRDLLPTTAVVRRDGRRQQVPVADLVPGDVVLLAAGDRISADLRTEVATALAVDESLLTGESMPRRVEVGAGLLAGTFVSEGPLLLLAVGSELGLLAVFLGVPPTARLLGGAWPTAAGWALAVLAIPLLLLADTLAKRRRSRRSAG
jgi:E1-E2 ATPase/Cation transporter/ATPase, N-terminus